MEFRGVGGRARPALGCVFSSCVFPSWRYEGTGFSFVTFPSSHFLLSFVGRIRGWETGIPRFNPEWLGWDVVL